MDLNFFKGKRITVFGLGLHGGGVGIVKFLAAHGARVVVTDIKSREQLKPSIEALKDIKNIQYVFGQHRPEDFTQVDMVIKTPPIPWNNKHLKLAFDKNIPVEMDSSLFFKLCKNPIIGITGTKGKTTTASIIYEILKNAGKKPVKVGIGQTSVLDKIDILEKETVPVFELSSWRLSALGRAKLSPHIAVIKNILPDHLNYYKTMESYIADKKNIFLYQKPKDWLIINEDDEILRALASEVNSQIIRFSQFPIKKGRSVFVEDDWIYLNDGVDTKKLLSVKDIKVRGAHNISNIMAAIGAAFAHSVKIPEIKAGVLNFKGIPHRLEFVAEVAGVKYFNDSAATIPEAVVSAINSFAEPIILIAGGNDKELDFTRLAEVIAQKVKNLILLRGNATDKLLEKIRKNLPEAEKGKEFDIVDSMEKAVEIASQKSAAGDAVLLSPGAASFGLFLNEFDRGDKFKAAVNKLKVH